MNTKHTPGPWTAGQFLSKAEDAESPDGMTFLCRVDGIPILVARDTLCDDPMADAKLIAAAPDMRAALRDLCATARTFRNVPKEHQEWTPLDDAALEQAFAALAKAGA